MKSDFLYAGIKRCWGNKIIKFLIVGGSSWILNLIFVYLFIDLFSFNSFLEKNIINLLAIEFCSLFSFYLNRVWTWNADRDVHMKVVIRQYIIYNISLIFGVAIRVIMFPLLESLHINYLLNITAGVVLASVISFFVSDKVIFQINGSHP